MEQKQNKSKSTYYVMHALLIVILLLVIGISLSYAYVESDSQNNFNSYTATSSVPCVNLTYSESGVIQLTDQIPVNDEKGSQLSPLTITVTNSCSNPVKYSLFMTSLTNGGNYIEDSKIKIKVESQSTNVGPSMVSSLSQINSGNVTYNQLNSNLSSRDNVKGYTPRTSYYITNSSSAVEIASNTTHTYQVRLWIDYNEGGENNSTQGKSYAAVFTIISPGIG